MILKQVHTSYRNLVINNDFPDPRVIEVEGRGYFAYATHDEFSPTLNNILLRHSLDLMHWSEPEVHYLNFLCGLKNATNFGVLMLHT